VTVIPGATGYRLPTEAEWEFACRAGTTSLWYFGWTAKEAQAMCARSVQEAEAYLRARTTDPNPFGLLGMYASADEWCWDWYDPGYYRKCADRGVAVDPQGPDSGEERITRGGSCYEHASGHLTHTNSAGRVPFDPKKISMYVGFGRVVLPIPAKGQLGATGPAPPPGANRVDPLAGWLQEVAALPAEEQVKAVAAKLKDLNPGFDGQVTREIEGGVVTVLRFRTGEVTDVAPVRALAGLRKLEFLGTWPKAGVTDLSPLRGMKLQELACYYNPVTDLSPLRGLPLRDLNCGITRITDLVALRGMKLEMLYFADTAVSDLAPLKGMPLTTLDCSRTRVSDLAPLKGMPLKWLKCENIPVTDLAVLRGMKLEGLWCRGTRVTDLSPLRGMPLRELGCDFLPERDAEVLRSLRELQTINGKPAAEFWKELDARPPPAKAPFNAQQARDHQKAWAKYLGVPVEYTSKSGMKFRLIPPGEFTMGLTEADAEGWAKFIQYKDQGKMAVPAHPVRLTRPFYLAEGEVRYRDFLDLMKREPGDAPKHPRTDPDGVLQRNCTWFDCIEFCNRLSEREGLTPAYQVAGREVTVIPGATGYRLPTEAEWEFACRAGTTSLWYFGLTVQEARAMADRSGPEAQGYLRARIEAPNPFGLLGMYAGASEWCWDWYDPGYYRKCADGGVAVDPQGPKSGSDRIFRGGSGFGDAGGDLSTINSVARFPFDPKKISIWVGFGRVVLPIPAKDQASSAVPGPNRPDRLAGWLQEVAALSAEEQVKAVAAKLKDLNPGFDGQVTRNIEGGVVTHFAFLTDHVTNMTPLRALTGVTTLDLSGSNWGKGQLADLEPLRGMRLTRLSFFANRGVADLSPLAGMKLTSLDCSGTLLTDLEPLRGMPLENLNCRECPGIQSLAPLQGMPLKRLDCSRARVTDLTPLHGTPLDNLAISCTPVSDLSPLRGMKLTTLGCKGTNVTDLSVLRGMPLKALFWDFRAERDAAILRSLETLERIDDKPVAEFWKEVDAKPGAQKP
jgi:formylglycine-generating enzyme required for sulfatase activity/Leucine-rich repeat (LRR) protein